MAIPTLAGNGPRSQMTRGRNRNTMVNTASHQSVENKLSPTRRASYGHQSKPNTQKTKHQRNESLQKLAQSATSAPASKPADVSQGTAALRGVGATGLTGLAAILQANAKSAGGNAGGKRNAGQGLRSDGSVASNIQLGRKMAKEYGWTDSQWRALKTLWTKESGWRTNADNPTSSAYGIPQALTQLHKLGKKYMRNPKRQIRWGLNYIAGRYGDPLSALRFHNGNNYY